MSKKRFSRDRLLERAPTMEDVTRQLRRGGKAPTVRKPPFGASTTLNTGIGSHKQLLQSTVIDDPGHLATEPPTAPKITTSPRVKRGPTLADLIMRRYNERDWARRKEPSKLTMMRAQRFVFDASASTYCPNGGALSAAAWAIS